MQGRQADNDSGISYVDSNDSDTSEGVGYPEDQSDNGSISTTSESESEDEGPSDQYSQFGDALSYLEAACDLWLRMKNNKAVIQDILIFETCMLQANSQFKQLQQTREQINSDSVSPS